MRTIAVSLLLVGINSFGFAPPRANASPLNDWHKGFCPRGWSETIDDQGRPHCAQESETERDSQVHPPPIDDDCNEEGICPAPWDKQARGSAFSELNSAVNDRELSAPAQIIAAPVSHAPGGSMDKRSITCPSGEEESSDDQGNLYCSKPLHHGPCLDECI